MQNSCSWPFWSSMSLRATLKDAQRKSAQRMDGRTVSREPSQRGCVVGRPLCPADSCSLVTFRAVLAQAPTFSCTIASSRQSFLKAVNAQVEPFCMWLGTVTDDALADADL